MAVWKLYLATHSVPVDHGACVTQDRQAARSIRRPPAQYGEKKTTSYGLKASMSLHLAAAPSTPWGNMKPEEIGAFL